MMYRGSVRNGVVVFDEPVALEEGTPVVVEAAGEPKRPVPGSPEAIAQLTVTWAGDEDELRRLQAEVQEMREADMTPMDEPNLLDEQ